MDSKTRATSSSTTNSRMLWPITAGRPRPARSAAAGLAHRITPCASEQQDRSGRVDDHSLEIEVGSCRLAGGGRTPGDTPWQERPSYRPRSLCSKGPFGPKNALRGRQRRWATTQATLPGLLGLVQRRGRRAVDQSTSTSAAGVVERDPDRTADHAVISPTTIGRETISISRSATAVASPSVSRSVHSTANSSPPTRATTSPGRTRASSRRAITPSTWSPTPWPYVSLISLKPSRSANRTAQWPRSSPLGGIGGARCG